MRIRIVEDGRILQGTPLQMVQQMQSVAFGREELTIAEYVDWVARQMSTMMGVQLDVRGTTAEERARSLLDALLRTGFAEKI